MPSSVGAERVRHARLEPADHARGRAPQQRAALPRRRAAPRRCRAAARSPSAFAVLPPRDEHRVGAGDALAGVVRRHAVQRHVRGVAALRHEPLVEPDDRSPAGRPSRSAAARPSAGRPGTARPPSRRPADRAPRRRARGCPSAVPETAAERRLGGRQPGGGHPERRARHVVEADRVEERDRRGVSPVLAADAEPERRLAPRPRSQPIRTARRRRRRRWSRTGSVEDAVLDVRGQELALRVVARDAEPVCVRSLVPNEKKSACGAIWSAQTAARGSSIIVPIGISGVPSSSSTSATSARMRSSSVAKPTSGIMIAGRGSPPVERTARRGPRDRRDLHRVDLGVQQADAAAARAEHRVRLVQPADARRAASRQRPARRRRPRAGARPRRPAR